MPGKKRVAILGAGAAGLPAVKSCLEEGLEPSCFEQYESIGGVWYYTKEYREWQGAGVFDSVVTNDTKHFDAYSDFPYPADVAPYLRHTEVLKYLKNYMNNFGLEKYISYNTRVTCVRRSRDYDVTGTWEVETVTNNGSPEVQKFDCVMVCSGFYKKPFYPQINGLDSFQGEILHSAAFRNGEKYRNQRVVVVGKGNSSGDLAAGTAIFADQVFYSVGTGMWMFPRLTENGVPYDIRLWTRANCKSRETIDRMMYKFMSSRVNLKYCGFCPTTLPTMSQIMVNDEVQNYIMNGKIKIHGRLVRLGPREAEFDDGSVVNDVDAVLFATGFDFNLDFLDEKIIEEKGKMSLYKMTFPLHLSHNTLALIGCQGVQGPNKPILELQTRLAAKVFSGNHQLPPRGKWTKDIDARNQTLIHNGRYRYTMPYLPLHDEIASELGVVPSWLDLIKAGPRVAYNYFYGPVLPFYDRIWGPHPWSGAKIAANAAMEHGYFAVQPRQCEPPQLPSESDRMTKIDILCLALFLVIRYARNMKVVTQSILRW